MKYNTLLEVFCRSRSKFALVEWLPKEIVARLSSNTLTGFFEIKEGGGI